MLWCYFDETEWEVNNEVCLSGSLEAQQEHILTNSLFTRSRCTTRGVGRTATAANVKGWVIEDSKLPVTASGKAIRSYKNRRPPNYSDASPACHLARGGVGRRRSSFLFLCIPPAPFEPTSWMPFNRLHTCTSECEILACAMGIHNTVLKIAGCSVG